ncbi:TPA: hypothetical protein N0F65_003837 [Lagenidium giganteum]|uniref:Uncharacterized protein n=1 Tax=Lagenidium giganteum TaxID=4803 RepID=A0AAV2YV30_9STRA|nr:TPA: hypothetical protein N0F65_003837 [Lagenidium giganteum]
MLASLRSTRVSIQQRTLSTKKSPSDKIGPITWPSLGLAAVVGSGAVYYYYSEKDRLQTQTTTKVVSVGRPLLGGPWTLVDCDTRQAVTNASFLGKYTLLYFGFTHCPDICPNELVRIGDVIDKLNAENAPEILPLFITVDPNRDTIAQMQEYKKDFHPAMKMLTGTRDQVADVTKAYRVYFAKADENDDDDDDYLVDHSIVMYLVGPDGQFLDFFTQSARVDDIVKKIKTHLFGRSSACEVLECPHHTTNSASNKQNTMSKRRSDNGQMRREDFDDSEEVGGGEIEKGFERASDEIIQKRRIVKARVAARPAGAAKPQASSNPFAGFGGLSGSSSSASSSTNPFAGFGGLSSAPKESASTSKAAPNSYQQAMEGLNKEFLDFVTEQARENAHASWETAVKEYIKYAQELGSKFESSKPVAFAQSSQPAPFSFGGGDKEAAKPKAATTASKPSTSLFAPKEDAAKTPAVPAFSFGTTKTPETAKSTTDSAPAAKSSGFSFNLPSSTADKDKPASAASSGFTFGAAPAATKPASTSTSGFTFGASASTTPAATSGFTFGASSATSKPASSAAAPAAASTGADADDDDENIGREEATVILKADNPDEDAAFETDKAKVFEFKKDEKRWADKGVHPLKVLVNKTTKGARILVRNSIGKIVINASLYSGLKVQTQETKGKKSGVTLMLQSDGVLTKFMLKVNTARVDDLVKALEDNTPK